MEPALARFADTIRHATAARTPLQLRGSGSKEFYGETPRGDVLDTRSHQGIIDYDPTELVITARCGTRLSDIESALAQEKQMLAFEPPHFGAEATIGGCLAAGLSGPRRQTAGAVRDFVLGATVMNHRGEVLHFGGRVMKNVAGYDVSRLLAGSLGTLGLIVEVSLKVLPQPIAEATLSVRLDETSVLRHLNEWAGKPLPVSASAWHSGTLGIRLSGANAAVEAAIAQLTTQVAATRVDPAQARQFWLGIREQTDPFFVKNSPLPLWRVSVPSTTAPLGLGTERLIEWGGALRWVRTDMPAGKLRAAVAQAGGHATLFRAQDKSPGVFHPLPPALLRIHRALKAEFDPVGIFNPGRLYPEF